MHLVSVIVDQNRSLFDTVDKHWLAKPEWDYAIVEEADEVAAASFLFGLLSKDPTPSFYHPQWNFALRILSMSSFAKGARLSTSLQDAHDKSKWFCSELASYVLGVAKCGDLLKGHHPCVISPCQLHALLLPDANDRFVPLPVATGFRQETRNGLDLAKLDDWMKNKCPQPPPPPPLPLLPSRISSSPSPFSIVQAFLKIQKNKQQSSTSF